MHNWNCLHIFAKSIYMKETQDNIIAVKSKLFALRIIRLYKYLCNQKNEFVISKQILRSGTSIGANVRESIRAQSKADFIAKMSISLKEASETEYWLELLTESDYIGKEEGESIMKGCQEIISILTKIIKTAKNAK